GAAATRRGSRPPPTRCRRTRRCDWPSAARRFQHGIGERGRIGRPKGASMPDSTKTTTTNWPRVLVVVPAVLAVTLSIFAWPAARLSPRDLPFGVAGPASATRPVEDKLARQHGAFDVHRYADE